MDFDKQELDAYDRNFKAVTAWMTQPNTAEK